MLSRDKSFTLLVKWMLGYWVSPLILRHRGSRRIFSGHRATEDTDCSNLTLPPSICLGLLFCLNGDVFIQTGSVNSINKITLKLANIDSSCYAFMYFSKQLPMFDGSVNKQEQVQEVSLMFGVPVCFCVLNVCCPFTKAGFTGHSKVDKSKF